MRVSVHWRCCSKVSLSEIEKKNEVSWTEGGAIMVILIIVDSLGSLKDRDVLRAGSISAIIIFEETIQESVYIVKKVTFCLNVLTRCWVKSNEIFSWDPHCMYIK